MAFNNKYLIRLDDACPTMNHKRWNTLEMILDKYGIKPMVGIIPNNEDPEQRIDPYNSSFWSLVDRWQNKGWAIAMHGYNHVYSSNSGGINPLWKRSEFAGELIEIQKYKIRNGIEILHEHGIYPKYFFAPSHTFDDNTLIALKEESDIRIISDTIARLPYKENDFIFLPQLGGACRKIIVPGIWTFCLHPNIMTEESFLQTEAFIFRYRDSFTSFDKIDLSLVKEKDLFSRIFSWAYFKQRRIRGIY